MITPKVVDIYHGDTVTDFKKAYDFGIRGVIHKATEGGSIPDKLYASRRPKAIAAGLLFGAYHFMRPGNQKAHAEYFLSVAKPDEKTLVAIDHEDSNVSLAQMLEFAKYIDRANNTTVLYSGFLIKAQLPHATSAQVDQVKSLRLWGCQYHTSWIHSDVNHHPLPWDTIWMWQYTDGVHGPGPHGVPGLQARMDVDSYGNSDEQLTKDWTS